MTVDSRLKTFHAEQEAWRVEVNDRDKEVKTCKVWYAGVLIFDGVSREALLAKTTLPAPAGEDWDENFRPMRPDEVVGLWTLPLMTKGHRIASARYVGTGMEGRTYCGRDIRIPPAGYLRPEPAARACVTCTRILDE